jgi:HAD superfamily hydrolase (TIGR01490 family)
LVVEWFTPSLSGKTKQIILAILFRGYTKDELRELGQKYFDEKLGNELRMSAMKVINRLSENKHHVVIVSASVDIWLQPVADFFGVELICTRAEYQDGIFTGRFSGKNCKGPEKAVRIKENYPISNYQLISYGNSAGDKEMFNLADKKLFRPFC